METALLSLYGGLASLLATSFGALFLWPILRRAGRESRKYNNIILSFEFAVGVMLSASLFGLIGPELKTWENREQQFRFATIGLFCGLIFIGFAHKLASRWSGGGQKSSKILFAAVLLLHNLPEGMGAGASMIGLSSTSLWSVQLGLATQNFIEGALLTLTLLSLGFTLRYALLGSLFSGVIELGGALLAGGLIAATSSLTSFFMCFAGGAMLMAVLFEVYERLQRSPNLQLRPLAIGLLSIPLIQFMVWPFE